MEIQADNAPYSKFSRVINRLMRGGRVPQVLSQDTDTKHLIDALPALRAEINLATPAAQRRLYGERQWYRDFIRIQKVRQEFGASTAKRVWRSLPPVFRRFQELFCCPEDRIVPRSIIAGSKQRISGGLAGAPSLLGVIVDPRRVPQKLSEDLGLIEFKRGRNSSAENLARRLDLHFLTRFKLFWESVTPLGMNNDRILVVSNIPAEVLAKYPSGLNVDVSRCRGYILISREVAAREEVERMPLFGRDRQLSVALYPDAHSALRRVEHIRRKYREEMQKLNNLSVKLSEMEISLKEQYRSGITNEEKDKLVEEAGELIDECLRELEGCLDGFKIRAGDFLTKARHFRDRLERRNVIITLRRVRAAVDRMERRLRNTRSISGHIFRDGMLLEYEINRTSQVLSSYGERVLEAARLLEGRVALFNPKQSERSRRVQAIGFLRRIALDPKYLKPIRTYPYILFRDKFASKYKQLVKDVFSGSLDKTRITLIEMHIIMKFLAVYETISKMKSIVAEKEHILKEEEHDFNPKIIIAELIDRVTRLRQLYNPRQIFSNYEVRDEYSKPFYQLRIQLNTALRRLRYYHKQDLKAKDATRMLRGLKRFLDGFDIGSIVRQLP